MSPHIRRMRAILNSRSAGTEAHAVPAAETAGGTEHADGEEGVAALT
jgi:hypothetical protein